MVKAGAGNALYYGDNLTILRDHIASDSVDLIYLDPPFNSNATYNVLFKAPGGKRSQAQVEAFDDTWHWNASAEQAFDEVLKCRNSDVSEMLRAMETLLKKNDLMAYLAMMTVRLLELHRVLKPTGSLYLHCDPAAGHYLKIILDAVFGRKAFLNEIIWQRTNAKGLAFTRFARNHDVIFSYHKSDKWTWNTNYLAHDQSYVDKFYRHSDPDGRKFGLDNLLNPNKNRPNLTYEFLGVSRVWRWTRERMEAAYAAGLVQQSAPGTVPRYKRYIDEQEGMPIGDVWTDIRPIQSGSKEALGYPTQKPVALLERIISASSNERDIVLDPFCGCGTTVHAAQKLKRRWIGIDVTHLAIALIRRRVVDAFPRIKFEVKGVPEDVGGAAQLAENDKHQFELWVLSMVEAQPYKGGRKGADGGVDGYIYFRPEGKLTEKAVVSVKGGKNVSIGMIRDLIATIEREKAKVGIFITLEDPTTTMRREAAAAGFFESQMHGRFERIQILTVAALFEGKRPHLPWIDPSVFAKAKREKTEHQTDLDL